MENKFVKLERFAAANSTENAENTYQEEGEDDDEGEALSFCDLPLDHLRRKHIEEDEERIPLRAIEAQEEDFDFCYVSKASEMCDANEVFFQGKIKPFRDSLSSGRKGSSHYHRSLSRPESIDGSSSMELFSSRSSSISSSLSSAAATPTWHRPPAPRRNHLHTHRSPPPRRTGFVSSKKISSACNILRLGILVSSPQETSRFPVSVTNRRIFRGRNCTGGDSGNEKIVPDSCLKRKPRGFLGGCNCSSNDAVDDTVRSRFVKKTKANAPPRLRESAKQQAAKKEVTRHRTYEWLKQLSLEDSG